MKVFGVDLSEVGRNVATSAKDGAPTLMSIAAVLGLGLTVFLSLKAKPKFDEEVKKGKEQMKDLEEPDDEDEEEEDSEEKTEKDEMTEKERKEKRRKLRIQILLRLGKTIAPAVLSALITIALILGANHINVTRIATLTAGYEAVTGDLKKELQKYKAKASEIVGEEKAADIERAVSEERLKEDYEKAKNNGEPFGPIPTGKGTTCFYDALFGTMFYSSKNAIESAVNTINRQTNLEMYVSLNEFRYLLKLPLLDPDVGEVLGFSSNGDPLEVTYESMTGPDGEFCYRLKYHVEVLKHRA